MITYKIKNEKSIKVYLDGLFTGTIRTIKTRSGKRYQYFPKGNKGLNSPLGGDIFPSLEECKKSLEEE